MTSVSDDKGRHVLSDDVVYSALDRDVLALRPLYR